MNNDMHGSGFPGRSLGDVIGDDQADGMGS